MKNHLLRIIGVLVTLALGGALAVSISGSASAQRHNGPVSRDVYQRGVQCAGSTACSNAGPARRGASDFASERTADRTCGAADYAGGVCAALPNPALRAACGAVTTATEAGCAWYRNNKPKRGGGSAGISLPGGTSFPSSGGGHGRTGTVSVGPVTTVETEDDTKKSTE